MRRLLAVLIAAVLSVSCTTDSATGPAPTPRAPDLDAATHDGCVTEGTCPLDPVVVIGEPGTGGGNGGSGSSGDGDGDNDGPGCELMEGGEPAVQACGSEYSPAPDDQTEEEYSDICPQPVLGKVATALVPIADRNHEFKFEGPFWRVNPLVGRSPAWYRIPRPTLSKDDWWMAESGNIQLVCWGRYAIVLGTRTWVGTMYVQSTDLHVVMGPGHPDF